MSHLERPYAERCRALADAGRFRALPKETSAPLLADFSQNDYLGLARHPALAAAAAEAARAWGVGATGARLLSGTLAIHRTLEARIAADKGTETSLLLLQRFPSQRLGHRGDPGRDDARCDPTEVFSDRLVHSSVHVGIRLAGAAEHRFRHNDLAHLDELLRRHRTRDGAALIIVETVYGMDGDCVDVDELVSIARAYDAMLYLDEAHATGLFGPRGYGLACALPSDVSAIVMGTFSKALGSAGAYVACSTTMRDYLVNGCSGFIFSTALAPPIVAAADAAWRMVPTLDAERERVRRNAARLRDRLRAAWRDIGPSQTQIVPILVGDDRLAVRLRDELRARGFEVAAIRPPTVPPNGARLRLSVAATHREDAIDGFVTTLDRLW